MTTFLEAQTRLSELEREMKDLVKMRDEEYKGKFLIKNCKSLDFVLRVLSDRYKCITFSAVYKNGNGHISAKPEIYKTPEITEHCSSARLESSVETMTGWNSELSETYPPFESLVAFALGVLDSEKRIQMDERRAAFFPFGPRF